MPKQRVAADRGRRRSRRRLGPHDRARAAAATRRPATHRPPVYRQYGPLTFALTVDGGEADSVEELGELVGDGIYVTRLHYLGIVDPREGVITGMTRDGTFRIRDGKIAEPLVNLRFTVSVPEMLEDVPGLDARAAARERQRLLRRAVSVSARSSRRSRPPGFNITGVGSEPGL